MKKKSKERQQSGGSHATDGKQGIKSKQQIGLESGAGADTEFALEPGGAGGQGGGITAGTRRFLAEISALQTLSDIQARTSAAPAGGGGAGKAGASASEEFATEVSPFVNHAAQSSAGNQAGAVEDHSATLAEIAALQALSDDQRRLDQERTDAAGAPAMANVQEEYASEIAPAPAAGTEDHTATIAELSALQAMSDAQARADRAEQADLNVNEEYAAEVAPPMTVQNVRQPVSKAEGQEGAGTTAAMKWIGYTALILAVLSLFVAPALLGSSAALFGFFAFVLGQRAIGALSILIGLISLAGYFILVPLYA
ncbi:hypothetical protein PM3016_5546 [Paenibacillus mucilaginosus 3016]|uniref:YqfX n=2 Tax=Paenibacillus mucilaginosus TaxID=61624 RepID=H6NGB5_9BACL|nr:hypothetical protein [Paenibacillus mucilaginosus]AFC32242.1 hypothetical protein PM3016_5546 [Paenibacillus mucilaginosus 3016]AFH64544.1 hypothetical protein B2K_28250 [Paenibacillus mucilaginosus K02]WFA20742.1 hypothetical protein ERY13_27590 [Paenibacillus mucilaginosus]